MASARGKSGIATQIHLASQAGLKVLEEGGSAFDAAIAASSVLTVVLPHTGDLGGDAFILGTLESGEIVAYNGSGKSPKAFDAQAFLREKPLRGPLTVTVPGLVDAWEHMLEHARFPLEKLLKKAIALSENGFPAPDPLVRAVERSQPELGGYGSWAREFQPIVETGYYTPKAKAHALRLIARRGPRAFYEDDGGLTTSMVEELQRQGVEITVEDFSSHRGERVVPIKTELEEHDTLIWELPPNSQGYSTLQLVKSLYHHTGSLDPVKDPEVFAKVVENVYWYRDRNLADPNHMEKSLEDLMHDLIVDTRSKGQKPQPKSGDTTFLTAVDKWGNQVGFIQSLYYPFGSGLVSKGILFQNRGHGFSYEPGLPNSPAPEKRPLHTLSIMLVQRPGATAVLGCAGGDLRPQIHLNLLKGLVHSRWNLARALEAPRVLITVKGKSLTRTILAETPENPRAPQGYSLQPTCPTPATGIANASLRLRNGLVEVASDPRSTGVALSI